MWLHVYQEYAHKHPLTLPPRTYTKTLSHGHTLKKAPAISHSLSQSISKSSPSTQLHYLPAYNWDDKSPLSRTHKEKMNVDVGREGEGE